jgi:hypothetical protein
MSETIDACNYSYEQKQIMIDVIAQIRNNDIIDKISQVILKYNPIKLYQDANNEIICRQFDKLANETYIEIQQILNDFNLQKITINNYDIDLSSNDGYKLKNSERRIINKHKYQQALEKNKT